jgi:multidrug efflux pump subunit AcrA (membrane-fusion protein)
MASNPQGFPSIAQPLVEPNRTMTQVWFQLFQRLFARVAVQTGTIVEFAGSVLPSGYLLCDGSAVSRATYGALFSAIATTWGPGDGVSTFNLPPGAGYLSVGSGLQSVGMTGTIAQSAPTSYLPYAVFARAIKT